MILSLRRCISLSISALLSLLRLQSLNCLSRSVILSLRRCISLSVSALFSLLRLQSFNCLSRSEILDWSLLISVVFPRHSLSCLSRSEILDWSLLISVRFPPPLSMQSANLFSSSLIRERSASTSCVSS
ncbi:hypothetical protein pCPXV0092 [Cowpox virus]|uniref:Uncharacterized protein n=1 Tax=Cowpox virus TaxID=10243 RepID=A0A212Q465_COWPX|nr:hypothetical protein pCPXV0092 [Cowpox virus]